MRCRPSDARLVGASAWPKGGGLGSARVRVRVSRVRA